MDITQKKRIIEDIVESYNQGDEPSKKYALNRLKLARFILKDETYFYLMKRMGQKIGVNNEQLINSDDVLIKAKKIMGGKIIQD